MSKIPSITDAEWEIMTVLWDKSPLTSSEIIESLTSKEWKPTTVKTLLSRLVKKGVLEAESEGRSNLYKPLYSLNECRREERKTFIQRLYGGTFKSLLTNFVEDEDLSKEEIDELIRVLKNKKK